MNRNVSIEIKNRVEIARDIIKYGGEIILDSFHKSIEKREKSRHDYVTEIDREIESVIDRRIRSSFPNDAVLGEENEPREGSSGYLWVVDPLDGTNNFVKGIPQAGVQIAIYENKKIVYGAILNPFVQQLYTASKGNGAMVEDLRKRYSVHLEVSSNKLENSMMIYDSGIAKGESVSRAIFDAFLGKVGWVRIFGVAVLDLPLIALGSADLLISNIPKPMDIAPGCLLVEEAGGVITDFEGNPWSLFSKNLVLGNKRNHPEALAIIKETIAV